MPRIERDDPPSEKLAAVQEAFKGTRGTEHDATQVLIEQWKATATNYFNLGGLIGTFCTIALAKVLGRRTMFGLYFAASAAAIMATFGLDLDPELRLAAYFLIGPDLTILAVRPALSDDPDGIKSVIRGVAEIRSKAASPT